MDNIRLLIYGHWETVVRKEPRGYTVYWVSTIYLSSNASMSNTVVLHRVVIFNQTSCCKWYTVYVWVCHT